MKEFDRHVNLATFHCHRRPGVVTLLISIEHRPSAPRPSYIDPGTPLTHILKHDKLAIVQQDIGQVNSEMKYFMGRFPFYEE